MMKADATSQRVVVDTNIWISAALTSEGVPALVARRVLARGIPVFTEATFAEIVDRLWRPKFDRYLSIELRRRILRDLSAVAFWTDVSDEIARQTFCRDPDDDKFIHAALSAGASWLVTGDKDLLDIKPPVELSILTPAQALKRAGFLE